MYWGRKDIRSFLYPPQFIAVIDKDLKMSFPTLQLTRKLPGIENLKNSSYSNCLIRDFLNLMDI